jgi:hypothetical protein
VTGASAGWAHVARATGPEPDSDGAAARQPASAAGEAGPSAGPVLVLCQQQPKGHGHGGLH